MTATEQLLDLCALNGVTVSESRLVPAGALYSLNYSQGDWRGVTGVLVPELTIYRWRHGGRWPFQCDYSRGEIERRREQRRKVRAR